MSRNLSAGHARNLFATLQRVGGWVDEAPRDPGPWRLISCNVRQEKTATIWLRRFGGDVYMPVKWEKVGRSGRMLIAAFPGYLFARLGLLTHDIANIKGVRGTVVTAGCPFVRDEVIAGIRSKEGPDGAVIIEKLRPRAKCEPGNVIRVTDGPFCGYPGVVSDVTRVKTDGAYKVSALVEIFGRPTPIEFEPHQFEVVALKDQRVRG